MKITSIFVFALALLLSACAHNTAGISVDSSGQVRVDSSSFASDVNVVDI
jgi:starvation-inducible outer membrane lipoprotein